MKRLMLLLLVVAACSQVEQQPENTTEPVFLGQAVRFNYTDTNVTLDGELQVTANYTGPIYIYTYCQIPFAILERVNTYWRYIYPDTYECNDPETMNITGSFNFPVENITFHQGEIGPGHYLFRIYYSTHAPGQYVREHDTEIFISE